MVSDIDGVVQNQQSNVDSQGFASLAVELIDLIISFLPRVPVPCYHSDMLPTDQYWGSRALTSLSRTCCRLRGILGPLALESFEACMKVDEQYIDSSNFMRRRWPKRLEHVLCEKMEGVARSSTSRYISVVTVVLTQDTNDYYSKFADFLSTLPNLVTLQIISIPPHSWKDLGRAFSNKTYPSVTRIVLDGNADTAAPSFPNATKVSVVGDSVRTAWQAALAKCPNITELDGNTTFMAGVWNLPGCLPRIEVCPFKFNLDPGSAFMRENGWSSSSIIQLKALKHLRTIQFQAEDPSQTQSPQAQLIIESAKQILRAVPGENILEKPKRIKIWYDNGEIEILEVSPDMKPCC